MWEFTSSYKHMFWYEHEDGTAVCIMGDIYRDCFEPTMTEKDMEYFKNLEGVTVMEVDGSD